MSGEALEPFEKRDLRRTLRAENVMTIMILSFVVAAAVFLNVVATWKAHQASGLTSSQKTAQTILAWIIPFFDAIAVIVVSTDPAERQKRAAAVAWATKKTRPDEG
jgi:hypothetical protein